MMQISLASGAITNKTNGIVIDVQNAAVLQAANDNGMTTCQASVSMTLPSEDLYQASQVQAANNLPSLQSRLAQKIFVSTITCWLMMPLPMSLVLKAVKYAHVLLGSQH
ncbi:hypothetical protein [Psychrobacter sp. WY6]|uniref:hypothetical protein n=1 Tax=Psychrobacter sp. WY6 TaxID=2708350 RepID=UPI002023041E|nr:hypothetical protein [Psychrobacter sp. WY6]